MNHSSWLPYVPVIALVIAIAAAVSAACSAYSSYNSYKIARSNAVQSLMDSYLKLYIDTSNEKSSAINSVAAYRSSGAGDRARIRILCGLQIQLIEAMLIAGDDRFRAWKEFIGGIPGPILIDNDPIEVFASRPEIKLLIRKTREKLKDQ